MSKDEKPRGRQGSFDGVLSESEQLFEAYIDKRDEFELLKMKAEDILEQVQAQMEIEGLDRITRRGVHLVIEKKEQAKVTGYKKPGTKPAGGES